jgi:hypothetical protein
MGRQGSRRFLDLAARYGRRIGDKPPLKSAEIFVLQVAMFGGRFKLGFESDPEGAWIDHNVYLDRAEAEARAREAETAPIENAGATT